MHTANLAAAYSGIGWVQRAAAALTNCGHVGVDLFFVLSGCVIAKITIKAASASVRSGPQRIRATLVFLLRRIARVYPLYWLTLAVMLMIPTMPGADNSVATFASQPAAVFLLQIPLAHPVAWTLTYEVQFYVAAGITMFFGRYAARAFVLWIVVEIGLVALAGYGLAPRFPLSDALSLEFCMGVMIGLFGQGTRPPFPRFLMAVSAVLALAASLRFGASWISVTTPVRALVWGVPSAFAVWGAVSVEREGTRFPKWMSDLGDISYSIYMWHLACLVLAHAALAAGGLMAEGHGVALYLVTSATAILVVSTISYRFFEQPINELSHTAVYWSPARRTRAVADAPAMVALPENAITSPHDSGSPLSSAEERRNKAKIWKRRLR